MNYAAGSEYSRSSPTVEARKMGAGPGAEDVRSWMENPKASTIDSRASYTTGSFSKTRVFGASHWANSIELVRIPYFHDPCYC